MKRFLTTLAVVLLCAGGVGADVTITQTMSVEGGMAAMVGGMMPRMVMRIKGLKSRTDIDVMGQTMSTIMDLATPQLTVLNSASRTAQIFGPGSTPVPGMAGATPKIDMSFRPTGQSRVIAGASCSEHAFAMSVNMADMGGQQAPPDAAAAMKDVRMLMSGSVWIATSGPGVADYVRFQKAATDAKMIAALSGVTPGQQSAGMEQLIAAASSAPGLPYLTEMTMTFEGSGKMVEMMKQMGPIKMRQSITAVSTDPIPDATFVVPDDFTVTKQ